MANPSKQKNVAKTKQPEKTTERSIRLRIICQKPPNPEQYGAVFGLQDNSRASGWIIHAGKVKPNGDIHFECECRVKPHQRTGAPNFLGEFVHGDTTQRFLYLSWRPKEWKPGQPEPASPVWVRRIKVHLSMITWEQINQALNTDGFLETSIAGTGRGGGPNCASVPLLGGKWNVRAE